MSSMAILGLIVLSMLIVLILNSSSLVSPVLPIQGGTQSGAPGPDGTLVVQLLSNQNERDRLSNPTDKLSAIGDKAMIVSQATNSSNPFSQVLVTDAGGAVSQSMSPGPYVVSLMDEALDINIPVQISPGNTTKLMVTIYGAAYPLIYSEESGVRPAAGSPQSNMYVELRSPTPVANVSEPVILKVYGTAPGAGYLVNATVVSRQQPTQGTQWLELGAAVMVDPVNATSIILTTWTYSSFIEVRPTGSVAPANV
jgi:hypothetical protein